MANANLAIRCGTLIDGTGAAPRHNVTVLVERGCVVGVADGETVPPGAQVIDARDRTVLPGLIDAHIHICSDGNPNPMQRLKDLVPFTAIKATVNARLHLEAGFTAVRDAGAVGYANIAVKQAIERGLVPGPRMRAPGHGLTSTGGHGDSYFRPEVTIAREGVVDAPDEARRCARLQLKMGADCIKLASATGGVMSDGDEPWAAQSTVDEMRAAAEEAHKAGKHCLAHAQGTQGIKNAIIAGVDSIEHGIYLDDEAIELLLKHGTFLVPTLAAVHFICEHGLASGIPEYGVRKAMAVRESHFASFQRAYRAGVKIAMGTDCGTPFNRPGRNAVELQLMCENGMTPMDAIVATTRTAAECLWLGDEIGTVEPGKWADLIVVDGDPLADIKVLQDHARIELVLKGGEIAVDRRAPACTPVTA